MIRTLSEIALPGTKANWFSEISDESRGWSLFVIILEIIL